MNDKGRSDTRITELQRVNSARRTRLFRRKRFSVVRHGNRSTTSRAD